MPNTDPKTEAYEKFQQELAQLMKNFYAEMQKLNDEVDQKSINNILDKFKQ